MAEEEFAEYLRWLEVQPARVRPTQSARRATPRRVLEPPTTSPVPIEA